jgi:murein DD-endopeptidase MepM/ murein hydrolase activator NlpD
MRSGITSVNFVLLILAGVQKMDRHFLPLALAFVVVLLPLPARAEGGCQEQLIKVTTSQKEEVTDFFVENLQAADVTVTFEMELLNLKGSSDFPCTITLPGKQKTKVFSLSPVDGDKRWNWGYTYYSTLGTMSAVHDDSYVYGLPFAPGASFKVTQGYHGKYSHFGANEHAIDWKMPVGTSVYAARGGVVVGAKDDSDVGGGDDRFDGDANYILIKHADGTLGHYVHLSKGGNKVKVGQTVQAGDLIGLSGNTGHSTGPHLHFSVFKARNGKERETIPVKFITSQGLVANLERGKIYRALDETELAARQKSMTRVGTLGAIAY